MVGGPAIFISYKHGHEASLALVTELEAALGDQDFRVWRDADIEPGDRWSDELWRWLMECSGAVAVVSDGATTSDWCRREWSVLAARQAHTGLRIVPVRVERGPTSGDILDGLQAVVADRSDIATAVAAVVERLQGLRTKPPSRADYLAAHRAWLRWQYHDAPALGREPFSLADVYIDTECGVLPWEKLKADRSIDPFSEEYGGRVDLTDAVLDCFGDPELREPVVVQGPAGSGKSAFSLHLANRLADEGLVPVVVRFRDLRLSTYDDVDELLQDAVRVSPVGEHPPPPTEPLLGPDQLATRTQFRGAEICQTVLILDGWDEVTLTGSARFQHQIDQWLPRLRQRFVDGPGPPMRLLLTGRPSAVVDRSGVLRKRTPVITIRPLRPQQLRTYADGVSSHLLAAGWQLDLARCERAFESYESWFTGDRSSGTDVLGSPLLALLAFRTLADWEGSVDDFFARPTALYRALIDVTVRHAGKAEQGPEGTVHRGGRTLRRLLQRVATIITAQGVESASFDELDRRLEDDGALVEWAEHVTSESTLHELVVNFYFKGHPELGCEFLHKSFREYLFAEAVVAALEVISEGHAGPQPPPPREWGQDFAPGSAHHTASRSLAGLLGPQWLTPEVRAHLLWLIEQAASADPERWVWIRDLLVDVWGWWGEGAHLRIHPPRRRGRDAPQAPPVVEMVEDELPRDGRQWRFSPSTNELDAHLGDALLQLTAFVHALLRAHGMTGDRECQVGEPRAVRFRPFNGEARNLIARIMSTRRRPHGDGLAGAHLWAVDLSDEMLHGFDFSRADLTDADLADASLTRINLAGANLTEANLTEADLSEASLTSADLTRTNLADADLTRADLADADLTSTYAARAYLARANLTRTNLADANLTRTNLADANLTRANLTEAKLTRTNLNRANLTDASLARANLTESKLTHTNLTRTNLADANLARANLTEAVLTHANLTRANLSRTNLANAKLTRADLRHADLTGANLARANITDAKLRGARLPRR